MLLIYIHIQDLLPKLCFIAKRNLRIITPGIGHKVTQSSTERPFY